ncbi:hypothetical protein EXIGLDRAFT_845911 [Exidia glandulosa HHB12029]|uniref:BTB domain-containing protein n=1 Tax=Exidia glandulosa HHB12029 TaxID=1314781 RepID=A0A165B8B1_EXIGL|nr:hypothetical protein EXIGLDRAFT_845911 [Exidia glandulosa HHB12029]
MDDAQLLPHTSFNFADSDVTLRSSDNVLFRVHRANLMACSVTFRDMFHVGKETDEAVALSEKSSTLAHLLAMCYPAEDPPVDFSLLASGDILDCYEAAVKYQMWVAGLALRSFVEPVVHMDPFRVVRSAHTLNDSVLMQKAVKATLELDILANAAEYRVKAGITWTSLLEYHFRYKREVTEELLKMQKTVFDARLAGRCYFCKRDISLGYGASRAAVEPWQELILRMVGMRPAAWPRQQLVEYFQQCIGTGSVGDQIPTHCQHCTRNEALASGSSRVYVDTWISLKSRAETYAPTCVFKV